MRLAMKGKPKRPQAPRDKRDVVGEGFVFGHGLRVASSQSAKIEAPSHVPTTTPAIKQLTATMAIIKLISNLALKYIPLLLLGATVLYGQSSTGLLAPSRAVDWSGAGAGSIPARTTVCTTLTSSATPSSVASALTACPAGETVLLGAGTYNWSSSLVSTASNVTLRGAGPTSTILNFTNTSSNCLGIGPVPVCLYNGDSGSIGFTANVLTVSSGMTQGSTSVVLGAVPSGNICGSVTIPSACSGSIANLHAGSLLIFNQLDDASDTGNAFFNGSTTYSQQGDGGNAFPGRSQIQVVTVTGISGSTVTFTPALYAPNWSSG